jgi:predicted nucleotidyltransferase
MKKISLNISGKIEPERIEALRIVDRAAVLLGIDFFIVGAWARDIIMEHGHGIKAPRMTRDMDIGIQVAEWKQFENIKRALIETGSFTETSEAEPHRLRSNSSIIDIIPFGGITGSGKILSWPPEHYIAMNLLGYEEAFRHAMTIRLDDNPVLDVYVPAIPGFVIMKLISWNDNKARDSDAQDVFFILENYSKTNEFEDIYEKAGLTGEDDFDMACIRLLGRWMRDLADEDTSKAICNILAKETDSSMRLIAQMLGGQNLFKERTERALTYLLKLKQGFEDSVVD